MDRSYVVEKVLLNENYIVRKLNSNKTQILHRIRLRKYEPNTVLQDIRPEGNLQLDDEIVIPQDDLYVITWETNFGEFPNSADETTLPTSQDGSRTFNNTGNDVLVPDEKIFTDVDLRSTGPQENGARAPAEFLNDEDLGSTGPHQNDDLESLDKARSDRINDRLDDQQSSGGSDTIVPEVLDDETDMIVENESPRGGKYNLRPNPTPNFTDEYRY